MSSLDVLYKELDFKSGDLFTATDKPSSCRKRSDWLEKGEWLSAAKRAGAEKIFFVENNPVAVFSESGDGVAERIRAFNKAWCLARPRLFFLASPGEITVYDLAQKPVDENKPKEWNKLKTLAVLDDIKEVSSKLQEFHRDNVESGRIFGDERFGDLKNRADKALIWDLKVVRRELIAAGLSDDNTRFAHALIGRSIFIRYLEDRGVLTERYFRNVAGKKAGWTDILRSQGQTIGADCSNETSFYSRVLNDKDFTFTLFRALARDFNGDMFPDINEEEQIITPRHLSLIQGLLYGNVGIQKKLFFYSYRFDIIPLDLISSIYEEFYHSSTSDNERKNKARQEGAYYTPPVLAEFVLSRALTPDVIKKTPRVLDPACGSGIFLVEAFRRIVRYEWHRKKAPLTFDELKTILRDQIAGIEVNEEAARITAFSLYLSMLHYLDPPAIDQQIKQGNKLPYLLASDSRSSNHYHCILAENAFDVETIESNAFWRERFGGKCADVVVGNPPWGSPGPRADAETKAHHKTMQDWCETNKKPIGDKEPSQAFLWRASDFLKTEGRAGLLVSAGVLFKHSNTTQAFRKQWLNSVRLNEVFNFTHVRKFFFKGAISPFLSVFFNKSPQDDRPVRYWSAKASGFLNNTQSIVFSKYDCSILRKCELASKMTWKTHLWGRCNDYDFIKYMGHLAPLGELVDRQKTGQGFKLSPPKYDSGKIKGLPCLSVEKFSRYDNLPAFSEAPRKVYRKGNVGVYEGMRLLVKRGISESCTPKGQVLSRYETESFCLSSAIIGVKLLDEDENSYKTLLGILWSSLSRYFFFLTSSTWGLWHDEIDVDKELLCLPIVYDKSKPATKRLISIVDKLRDYHPQEQDVFCPDGVPEKQIEARRRKWEAQLDEVVFELYGLNEEQKDLIRDCCEVTLPFLYEPFDSVGAMTAVEDNDYSWIENYVNIFSRRWNTYLDDGEEMRAEVHVGAHGNMVAIEFYPADKGDLWDLKPKHDSWGHVLEQIGNSLPKPMGISRILLDGVVHAVSENGVIIIKRNEKRFWTRSLAREDAEATLCKRMVDTSPAKGRNR